MINLLYNTPNQPIVSGTITVAELAAGRRNDNIQVVLKIVLHLLIA